MVYDCFIFFTELDVLKLHLRRFYHAIDKFVSVKTDKIVHNKSNPYIFEDFSAGLKEEKLQEKYNPHFFSS